MSGFPPQKGTVAHATLEATRIAQRLLDAMANKEDGVEKDLLSRGKQIISKALDKGAEKQRQEVLDALEDSLNFFLKKYANVSEMASPRTPLLNSSGSQSSAPNISLKDIFDGIFNAIQSAHTKYATLETAKKTSR
jgi:hypothetical protein